MDDLISREVVISAVKRLSLGETDATRLAMRIGDYLKRVPSAQLVDKDMNVPCTDAIDRQAAIRWVKTECNPYGKPTLEFESGKKVIEHLEQMPSAQPERIRGRWEIYVISMLDGEGCKCSECGFEGVPYWDFCPNCGADMREDQ